MPYQKAEEFTFTLEGVDCPELWVRLKDPRTLGYREQRRAQQAQFILMRVQRGRYVPGPEDDFAITAMDDVVRKLLVDWNLPYPDDWDQPELRGRVIPLAPPRLERKVDPETKEEVEVLAADGEDDPLGPLPAPVLEAIVKEVGRLIVTPPKSPAGRGPNLLPAGRGDPS